MVVQRCRGFVAMSVQAAGIQEVCLATYRCQSDKLGEGSWNMDIQK